MSRPWFVVKRYGIGLSPSWPAGWIVLAVWIVALALSGLVVDALKAPAWALVLADAALTAALLVLIALKNDGKPWRWRQGDSAGG
jgi:hypothetical protein